MTFGDQINRQTLSLQETRQPNILKGVTRHECVTDAGYKSPWFREVLALWDIVGRVVSLVRPVQRFMHKTRLNAVTACVKTRGCCHLVEALQHSSNRLFEACSVTNPTLASFILLGSFIKFKITHYGLRAVACRIRFTIAPAFGGPQALPANFSYIPAFHEGSATLQFVVIWYRRMLLSQRQ